MPGFSAQDQQVQAERLRVEELRKRREREIETHVQAIKRARADVEVKLRELVTHCASLQQATRRWPAEDGSDAAYRIYHTAHSRLAGAIVQAVKRAQATDRFLDARRADAEDLRRQEREEELRDRVDAAMKEVFNLQLPKDDDFETLFGDEVNHAP